MSNGSFKLSRQNCLNLKENLSLICSNRAQFVIFIRINCRTNVNFLQISLRFLFKVHKLNLKIVVIFINHTMDMQSHLKITKKKYGF